MDRSRADAPERESRGQLYLAWEDAFGWQRVTSSDVLRAAGQSEALREALKDCEATDRAGNLTAKSIGERLRALKGRIVDGRSLAACRGRGSLRSLRRSLH
jgi:hypothetical protein